MPAFRSRSELISSSDANDMTTSAEMASRKFYEYLLKVRAYFLGNFSSSELGYVVFPFLKIFKLFGFMPIRLDQSYLFDERSKMVWDLWAILWSFLGSVIYVGKCVSLIDWV